MAQKVELRDVIDADLPIFFAQQRDPEAARMAAFPPRDLPAFMAHWAKIRGDAKCVVQTIVGDGQVAGYVGSWLQAGDRLIGYWLGKAFWGQGVATRALALFVARLPALPLFAHVARTNPASIRVLEKCGFALDRAYVGEDGQPYRRYVHRA